MKGHSSGHHHHSHTPIKSGAAGVRPMSAGFALNRSAADRQRQSHMNHINNSINNGGGGAGGGRAGGVQLPQQQHHHLHGASVSSLSQTSVQSSQQSAASASSPVKVGIGSKSGN